MTTQTLDPAAGNTVSDAAAAYADYAVYADHAVRSRYAQAEEISAVASVPISPSGRD